MSVFLVRHGESEGNLARVFSGVTDHALTPLGRRQAVEAAGQLAGRRFAALFTSTLSRAIDTAALILEHGGCACGRVVRHHDLDERNFGVMEAVDQPDPAGLPPDHPARLTCLDVHHRPPGGESIGDTQARAVRYFQAAIAPVAEMGDVLVVAHGNVIKGLVAWHLGWPLDLVPEMPMRNCLITRFP